MKIKLIKPEELHSEKLKLLKKAIEIGKAQTKYNYRVANRLQWIWRELKKIEDKLGGI